MPDEVLSKMGAPPKPDDPIATAEKLTEFDGILFGLSMRFGMAPAQVKALMDSTGGLWAGGKLVGKPAGIFFATAQQGGGQESGALGSGSEDRLLQRETSVTNRYKTPKLSWG